MGVKNEPTLILASSSPRRYQLISQAGLKCSQISPHCPEIHRPGESPRHFVKRLAREKAESLSTLWDKKKNLFILAADTVVVRPDGEEILGKPRNSKDAFRMLKLLSGKTHSVFTGYCILHFVPKKKMSMICRAIHTRVTFLPISDGAIRKYIKTLEPMDKAGAYGAQGAGSAFIDQIQGSFTNVIGLPLSHVLADFEVHFEYPLFSWLEGKSR